MEYTWQEAGRRYPGRLRLVPDIDWNNYHVSVHLDTLKVRCILIEATKPNTLKKVVSVALSGELEEKVFVEALSATAWEAGRGWKDWEITVEDPWSETAPGSGRLRIDCLAETLSVWKGLEAVPTVQQLDLAVDFKPEGVARVERMKDVYEVLARSFMPPVGVRSFDYLPRYGHGGQRMAELVPKLMAGDFVDRTVYWGPMVGNEKIASYKGVQWKLYRKVRDREREMSTAEQHVRFEVSMDAVGLETVGVKPMDVDELKAFDFFSLNRNCFRFMRPTLLKEQAVERVGKAVALNGFTEAVGGRAGLFPLAYSGLNRLVGDRLRYFRAGAV